MILLRFDVYSIETYSTVQVKDHVEFKCSKFNIKPEAVSFPSSGYDLI